MAVTTRWWDNSFDMSNCSDGRATKHGTLLRKIKRMWVQGKMNKFEECFPLCWTLGSVGEGWEFAGKESAKNWKPWGPCVGTLPSTFRSPSWFFSNRSSTPNNFFFVCVIHCCSSNLVMQQDYLLVFYSSASWGYIKCRSPLSCWTFLVKRLISYSNCIYNPYINWAS